MIFENIEIRNPKYTFNNYIDVEFNHPEFGWMPFTASPTDVEPHGKKIYELALEMNPEPFVSQPLYVPDSMTFAQLIIGLVSENWLSIEEARNWRDRISLPAAVTAMISTLPADQQFLAETRAMSPSVIYRNDPLTIALITAAGKTTEEMDNFFIKYSGV